MVRFGAKKEEFIPPFLFYFRLKQKKEGTKPSLYLLVDANLCMLCIKRTYRIPVHHIKKCRYIIWASVLIV